MAAHVHSREKSSRAAYTGRVELKVYPSERPFGALVLAHGAGAGQTSSFMVRVATGLAHRGLSTATFDFAYMAGGRKVPDRTPVLESTWREAIATARQQFKGLSLFIGGKSMGGRIASHIASQGGATPLAGLIFLGYPLHPPGRPDQRRDAHLAGITEPMLFVQGSRDAFGTAGEIRQLLRTLPHATLEEVEGGDHSFKVPGGVNRQDRVLLSIMDVVARWASAKAGH
jgi:predicted alpha/beta-hydrolase family hydrolase